MPAKHPQYPSTYERLTIAQDKQHMSLRRSRRHSPLANAPSNACCQGQGFSVSELAIPHPSQRQRQQRTTFSSHPVFEVAAAGSSSRRQIVRHQPSSAYLLKHRPQALLARVPQAAVLFTAGAVAGAVGKSLTAPLDRVKLLLQTRGGLQSGAVRDAARHGSVWQALQAIGREEGIRGYWKGNLPQASRTLAGTGCMPCMRNVQSEEIQHSPLCCGGLLLAYSARGADLHARGRLERQSACIWQLQLCCTPYATTGPDSSAASCCSPCCGQLTRHCLPQILRVVPYSATQLYSYEVLKRRFRNERGELTVPARLAAGGCAGMVATLVSLAQLLSGFNV